MTLKEASTIAGIPIATVSRWIENGLIRPKGYVRKRGRIPVEISPKELNELKILAQLRDYLSMEGLRAVLRGSKDNHRFVRLCADKKEAVEVLVNSRGRLFMIELLD